MNVKLYPVYKVLLSVPNDQVHALAKPIFEQDGTQVRVLVDTRLRIFDITSRNRILDVYHAGCFGRIRPDHVVLKFLNWNFMAPRRKTLKPWNEGIPGLESVLLTEGISALFTRRGVVSIGGGWFNNPALFDAYNGLDIEVRV